MLSLLTVHVKFLIIGLLIKLLINCKHPRADAAEGTPEGNG